ncbi:MAG: DUF3098 domain-containing protein [Bacteroidetes bacterium]|nr:DUF3098 domain-containing protein [Bacteroidota bacterium]
MATKQISTKEKQTSPPAKSGTTVTPFIFDRTNYIIMAVGVVVILVGFMLMSGGATNDPNVFPKEEIYSFRRITLAPIVVLIGFALEAVAILKRPKI